MSTTIILFNACKDDDNIPQILNDINISSSYEPIFRVKTQESNDFVTLSEKDWNINSVNKILNTFTYGIKSNLNQINLWANMKPEDAIKEMLSFDSINYKIRNNKNSFITDQNISLVQATEKFYEKYEQAVYFIQSRFSKGWTQTNLIVDNTNYNPFKIKLGLWETNYHQVLTSQIDQLYILHNNMYFDQITKDIFDNVPYQNIMAHSASTMPILLMYNQFDNVYDDTNDILTVNDDFAREYNQLFFGILGVDNLSYYENTTIESTSKILTGMNKKWITFENSTGTAGGYDFITYPDSDNHFNYEVEANQQIIQNTDFQSGLYNLANVNINITESQENLPIMIISGLADDNIEANIFKKNTIINAWKNMEEKNILLFLQKYAISYSFHSSDRIKYMSSLDRYMKVYNLLNFEGKTPKNVYIMKNQLEKDKFVIDVPAKGVFGNWTGVDVKDNTEVFTNFYTNSINNTYNDTYTEPIDFSKIIDENIDKNNIKEVAEFLWSKLIGDNLKNFNELERLQTYSLLFSGKDYNSYANITENISENDIYQNFIVNQDFIKLEKSSIINTTDIDMNTRINNTVHFILGTPYNLYEEGI